MVRTRRAPRAVPPRGEQRGAVSVAQVVALSLFGSIIGTMPSQGAAQEETDHPEWCAGAGTRSETGWRCPETHPPDVPCPPGCQVTTQSCALCGETASMVAIVGCVVVVLAFMGGVIHPLMADDRADVSATV